MTRPDSPADADFTLELVDTIYGHGANIIFAIVCVVLLLICDGLFYNMRLACTCFALFVPVGLARYWTISSPRRDAASVAMLVAGLVWAAMIGLICGVGALAGLPILTVLSGLVATGIAFSAAYINAGAPRLAKVQACLFTLPYAVIAGLSNGLGMILILLQLPLWLLCLFVLIGNAHATQAKLIRAHRLAQHLAFYDSLTGLPNRAKFMERLAVECEEVPQNHAMSSYVLYLDLDGFKTVNDTFGHSAGDDLLRSVAQRFQLLMRPGDLFGRLGGDEFALILSTVSAAQAKIIGERLITAVQEPFLLGDMPPIRIGVSIGGAALASSPDVSSALHAADTMLYAAKRAGKGTLCLAKA